MNRAPNPLGYASFLRFAGAIFGGTAVAVSASLVAVAKPEEFNVDFSVEADVELMSGVVAHIPSSANMNLPENSEG